MLLISNPLCTIRVLLRSSVTIEQAKQWNRKSFLLFSYLSRALDLGTDIKLKPETEDELQYP